MADQAGTVIELLKVAISCTITLVDNYNSAFPNAKSLKSKITSINILLENFKGISLLPVNEHIENITQQIEGANKSIMNYFNKREKYKIKKSHILIRPYYILKLAYHSWDSNQEFNTYTQQLDYVLRDIQTTLKVTNIILKPTALHYIDEMKNEESIEFWKQICGNEIHNDKTSWPLFASRYQQKYNTVWSSELKTKIKSAALVEGDFLNIFGFINLTSKAGFPLNYDQLPDSMDCVIPFSTKERLEIANLLSVHIKEYHSTKMLDDVFNVKAWFENKNDHQSIQERAEECYIIIQNMTTQSKNTEEEANYPNNKKINQQLKKNETDLNNKEKEASVVDKSKIDVIAFYEIFTSNFQCGQLSNEILKDMNFPSKRRMKSFLYYFEPLDRAYHRLAVKNGEILTDDEWNHVKPSAFKFIEHLLSLD